MPRVTFKLAGDAAPVVAEIAIGDSVFNAGAQVMAAIDTACVGKGTCGLCRVRVLAGADALTPYTDEERKHLGNLYHLTKVRLACRARLIADAEVMVEVVRKKVR